MKGGFHHGIEKIFLTTKGRCPECRRAVRRLRRGRFLPHRQCHRRDTRRHRRRRLPSRQIPPACRADANDSTPYTRS
jgi:ssDNA-binding Zn-finger/Zn-ribbon topoisomerase 1